MTGYTAPSLFDGLTELSDPVRASDPDTSAQAAASMRAAMPRAKAEVLDALTILGGIGTGAAVNEVIQRWRHTAQTNCTTRRLHDLEDDRLVVRTDQTEAGPTGRQQTVWRLA